MVKRVMPEVRTNTTISRQRFIFQLVIINELRFIYEEPRKRERVRRARAVLGNDNGNRAIIESHHMLIIRRFRDRLRERTRRFASHHIMHTFDVAPPFPSSKETGQSIGQSMLKSRHHNSPCASRHTLHITQHKRRGNGVCLTRASPCHNHGGFGTDVLCQKLRFIEVHAVGVYLAFFVPKGSVHLIYLLVLLLVHFRLP